MPLIRQQEREKASGRHEDKGEVAFNQGSHDDEGTDGEMSFPEPTQEQKSALLEFDCLAPGTER